jgi:hypothetical protein
MSILLVEADHDARLRHEAALRGAGFFVISVATWIETVAVQSAEIILADLPTFHVLRLDRVAGRFPAVVVLASDIKSGVGACLCGAVDWHPMNGENAYLVDTVEHALQS